MFSRLHVRRQSYPYFLCDHSKKSGHTSLTLESYHSQTAAPNLPFPVSIRNAKINLLFRLSHTFSISPDHPKLYRSARQLQVVSVGM